MKSPINSLHLVKLLGKSTFLLIGLSIVALAGLSYVTNMPLPALLQWAQAVFGWSFALLFSGLTVTGVIASQKLRKGCKPSYWYEVGQQAANGISTLALTFTLLGISLGIGSLSEQPLSPDNIQAIISNLTKQFSTAFMTTVVGLPVASLIRAWVGIQYYAVVSKEESPT